MLQEFYDHKPVFRIFHCNCININILKKGLKYFTLYIMTIERIWVRVLGKPRHSLPSGLSLGEGHSQACLQGGA